MTTYNVHIYREMRLVFGSIEADSQEAAASIAAEKPTTDTDSIEDCDGQSLAALVDVVGDEEYEQSRVINFEPERQRRAAPKLLHWLRVIVDRLDDHHERLSETEHTEIELARAAIAEATAAGISPADGDTLAARPYSVLLLYPDYANDGGTETYYAFVSAADSVEAVAQAQQQAATAQVGVDIESDDFVPLLVTQGHHYGQSTTN
jgi:hypothetical protein